MPWHPYHLTPFKMGYWNLGGWAAADGGAGVRSKDLSMRGGMQD
jgi:hypothetical protein